MAIYCDGIRHVNRVECISYALIVGPLWELSIYCAAVALGGSHDSALSLRREGLSQGLRSRAEARQKNSFRSAEGLRAARRSDKENPVPHPSTALRAGSTVLAFIKTVCPGLTSWAQ